MRKITVNDKCFSVNKIYKKKEKKKYIPYINLVHVFQNIKRLKLKNIFGLNSTKTKELKVEYLSK